MRNGKRGFLAGSSTERKEAKTYSPRAFGRRFGQGFWEEIDPEKLMRRNGKSLVDKRSVTFGH
ncbi:hypothetical protein L484_002860 [Morus notabilis]|uniref:Uncharacterized protein n=1 Tax=Morus notabilis TaxID=981085 RepID=W9R4X2_9ROSA|nr:hypothetical protein L484_002860 [Morus notabilis]